MDYDREGIHIEKPTNEYTRDSDGFSFGDFPWLSDELADLLDSDD